MKTPSNIQSWESFSAAYKASKTTQAPSAQVTEEKDEPKEPLEKKIEKAKKSLTETLASAEKAEYNSKESHDLEQKVVKILKTLQKLNAQKAEEDGKEKGSDDTKKEEPKEEKIVEAFLTDRNQVIKFETFGGNMSFNIAPTFGKKGMLAAGINSSSYGSVNYTKELPAEITAAKLSDNEEDYAQYEKYIQNEYDSLIGDIQPAAEKLDKEVEKALKKHGYKRG